jgi:hypothetical protein
VCVNTCAHAGSSTYDVVNMPGKHLRVRTPIKQMVKLGSEA